MRSLFSKKSRFDKIWDKVIEIHKSKAGGIHAALDNPKDVSALKAIVKFQFEQVFKKYKPEYNYPESDSIRGAETAKAKPFRDEFRTELAKKIEDYLRYEVTSIGIGDPKLSQTGLNKNIEEIVSKYFASRVSLKPTPPKERPPKLSETRERAGAVDEKDDEKDDENDDENDDYLSHGPS